MKAEDTHHKVELAQQGDDTAMAILVDSFYPVIYRIAMKFNVSSSNMYKDLQQEGYIGLLKAIKSFNPSKGTTFVTYASSVIRNNMLSFLAKENKQQNIVKELNVLSGEGVDISNDEVLLYLQHLPSDQAAIVSQKIGLMQPKQTYKEIAEVMHLSVGQVRYKYNKAVSQIKETIGEYK